MKGEVEVIIPPKIETLVSGLKGYIEVSHYSKKYRLSFYEEGLNNLGWVDGKQVTQGFFMQAAPPQVITELYKTAKNLKWI